HPPTPNVSAMDTIARTTKGALLISLIKVVLREIRIQDFQGDYRPNGDAARRLPSVRLCRCSRISGTSVGRKEGSWRSWRGRRVSASIVHSGCTKPGQCRRKHSGGRWKRN